MDNFWIIAQADANQAPSRISSEPVAADGETTTTVVQDANATGTPVRPRRPFGPTNFIFIGLMLVVMYMLLFRGPRKKQQQHKQMVQALQKNDRVRTIGGIIGTVVDIKGDEVTLKVDESTNTKIRVASSAIGRNMSKDKD
ncbi:MAG: preprotein translocase subunit YajC [Phycisphaerales bacterium]|nr:MAG: preprotein translocase subunit YajC [Phycisphaerales bacterium]